MPTYINKSDKSIIVSAEELPADAGYVPLRYEYPEYDPRTQELVKDGEPTLNKKQGCYVQKYKAVELSPERIAQNLDSARDERRAEVATIRWNHEIAGIIMPDGLRVMTTNDAQVRLSTLVQSARDAGLSTVNFKAESGFVELTLNELLEVSKAVTAHVQACYTRESELNRLIDEAADFAALAEIHLEEGWPEYEAPASEPSEEEVLPELPGVMPDISFTMPEITFTQG